MEEHHPIEDTLIEEVGQNEEPRPSERVERLGGIALGIVLGAILFLVPEAMLTDRARILLTLIIGVIAPGIAEKRTGLSLKIFSRWMVTALGISVALKAVILLVFKLLQ